MGKNNEGASDKLAPFWGKKISVAKNAQDIAQAKRENKPIIGLDTGANSAELWGADYVVMDENAIDEALAERVYKRHTGEPWTIAETKRCIIRELTMDDIDALFELYSKPGITDFVEPLYDYDKECEYERAYIEHMYGYYEYGMWLVFSKDTGELIGRAGLENRDYCDEQETQGVPGAYHSEMELGYIIAPEYQRQGYATEVCQAILEYAWENLCPDRINCLIDENNYPSRRLVEKLGFQLIGKTDVTGESLLRYVISNRDVSAD